MNVKTKKLVSAAVIGALYAVLTMALSPISYGPLQLRLSEALCLLPFFVPYTSWGLFFGCAIANLVSAAGILDIVFGSLATLLSCLLAALCGKSSRSIGAMALACLMPVLCNGVIVGAVLTYALAGLDPLSEPLAFAVYAGQIAAGEAAVMYVLALPLFIYLRRQKFFADFCMK